MASEAVSYPEDVERLRQMRIQVVVDKLACARL